MFISYSYMITCGNYTYFGMVNAFFQIEIEQKCMYNNRNYFVLRT